MNISHAIKISPPRRAVGLMGLILLSSGAWQTASAQGPIAAGFAHSCSITGGRLSCWGNNDFGQLGDGTTRSKLLPVAISAFAEPVDGVAAGDQHTCAISNGALSCWGSNGSGQLGNGSSGGQSLTPAAVGGLGSGVTAVAAGRAHTCAIVDQGLKCWGANQQGQLGTGDTQPHTSPVDVFPAQSGITFVTAGSNHTCAIKTGTAYCWGDNSSGQLGNGSSGGQSPSPTAVSGLAGVIAVAAGEEHSCALLDTAKVACWGGNGAGQLGDGTAMNSPSPVTVRIVVPSIPPVIDLAGIEAIDAGSHHACAIGAGRAYCWGSNELGQVGDGTTVDAHYATRVLGFDSGVTAIVAGSVHTCAVRNGIDQCWGSDLGGQVGDYGPNSRIPFPVPIPALDLMTGITAGGAHGCGKKFGSAFCWGANESGQLGDGSYEDRALPGVATGLELASVTRVTAGAFHGCAMTFAFGTSEVRCWGEGSDGQIGDDSFNSSSIPVPVSGLGPTTDIDAGDNHTCAAVTEGPVIGAECWGKNDRGQIGNDTFDNAGEAYSVIAHDGAVLNGVDAVSAGGAHSCALVNAGVRCWGANDHGQLGNDSTDDWPRAYPVTNLGNNSGATMISAGGAHTCAIVNLGVKCWGFNADGQLGDGTRQERHVPVTVFADSNQTPLGAVTAMAAGAAHTCAVASGGVVCWGDNSSGQLGDGSFTDASLPVTAIPAASGMVAVTAGADFTCATNNQNHSWCWGNALYGRLANGSLGYTTTPVPVDFDTILRSGFEVLVP